MLAKIFFASIAVAAAGMASELKTIVLPKADRNSGKPLMAALAERKSTRKFNSEKPIPETVLGNMLWAGNGFNRPDKRTVPSAMNRQEIDLYVLKKDGVWFYDAAKHALVQKKTDDLRAYTAAGTSQNFVKDAPIVLVIVADTTLQKEPWRYADGAFVVQNIYLYCASEGLNTVVRGMYPEDLAEKMGLDKKFAVLMTQPVGY